jgi:Mrp family chromosome partitioning ATPase/capsular polysaccharide biosynthesis protein
MVAVVLAVLPQPVYEADVELFVTGAQGAGQNGAGELLRQEVRSYPALVTSPRLLAPVARRMHVSGSAQDLARRVHAVNPTDSLLLEVGVQDGSPARARDLAAAIADELPRLVAELHAPAGGARAATGGILVPAGGARAPVTISVTRPATLPTGRLSPRPTVWALTGLLVGAGLGLLISLLRTVPGRTVTDRRQLLRRTGLPVVAEFADEPAGAGPSVPDLGSPRGDALRRLGADLRLLAVDRRVGCVMVTAPTPGDGALALAADLAVTLAADGQRVLLVDADLRGLDDDDDDRAVRLGLPRGPGSAGLTGVLASDVTLADAVRAWRSGLLLDVLPAGAVPPDAHALLASDRMARLVSDLTDRGTRVVIAAPPLSQGEDAVLLARLADVTLLVARAGTTRVGLLIRGVRRLQGSFGQSVAGPSPVPPARPSRAAPRGPILALVLLRAGDRPEGEPPDGDALRTPYTWDVAAQPAWTFPPVTPPPPAYSRPAYSPTTPPAPVPPAAIHPAYAHLTVAAAEEHLTAAPAEQPAPAHPEAPSAPGHRASGMSGARQQAPRHMAPQPPPAPERPSEAPVTQAPAAQAPAAQAPAAQAPAAQAPAAQAPAAHAPVVPPEVIDLRDCAGDPAPALASELKREPTHDPVRESPDREHFGPGQPDRTPADRIPMPPVPVAHRNGGFSGVAVWRRTPA